MIRYKIIVFIAVTSFFVNVSEAKTVQINIDKNWTFKQARSSNWYPAQVPGTVHTDLMDNGIIDDPFIGLNERTVQWVDKEDWVYETSFDIPYSILEKGNVNLSFKGLDTYADVFLNDEKILETNNMFREWNVDVKKLIRPSGNILSVYFHSPIKKALPLWKAYPFQYKASNDQSKNGGLFDKKLSVFTRKAGYHYGWDWGPRLVTSGVWRPVILEAWDDAIIENVHFVQKEVSAKKAVINVKTEVTADRQIRQAKIQIIDNNTEKILGETTQDLQLGSNLIEIGLIIKNPKLWWCNGMGEQHLYNLRTQLVKDADVLDRHNENIGIRSIKLVKKPDEIGETFYFEINGKPFFSKGANYIPCDMFLPRVTKEIYEKTVLDAVNANMNMLRVWGGGVYEDDYFYELCDKYGILVWQDFMFACSIYPAEGELLENIRQEAIDNVRRLRNHPSIAVWCGNNECLDAWFNWGWKKYYDKLNPAYSEIIWKQYYEQYHVVLPDVVKEHDPMAAYVPSSPYSDIDGRRSETDGDYHYWNTWQHALPTTTFNNPKSRFFSEYGYQSFPMFETVKKYALKESDWVITSDVVMWHQRGGKNANSTINKTVEAEYGTAKNFESFLYLSQLLQGDAIKTAIEAHRRNMPYCMGSLYWQHNDCWPVASWSSRDYYGQWKAQHYYTRKAFDDILISPIVKDGKLKIHIISDRTKTAKGELRVQLLDFYGKVYFDEKRSTKVFPNSNSIVFSIDTNKLLDNIDRKETILYVSYDDKKYYDNIYFFQLQKELLFPKSDIDIQIISVDEGYEVILSTKKFVRGVYLSVNDDVESFFDDNFFDLIPGQQKKVTVRTKVSFNKFKNRLKVIDYSQVIDKVSY